MSEALAGKLAKAISNLGGRLKADKRNMEQRYDYISADKVLSEAGQALAEQGIAVLTSITEEANVETAYTNSRGEQRQRYDCRVALVMTVTDGETQQIHTWLGRGSDFSVPDKAMYKAITSGHKYFLMKLLSIGEGNEDGEHQPVEEGKAPASGNTVTGGKTAPATNGKAPAPVGQPTHRTAPAPALKATPDGVVDVDFRDAQELMTKAQRGMMHAIGSQLFGDNWDMARHDLVKEVTGGRTTSSSEVLKAEAKVLLDKLAASVRATMTPEDAAEFLANTKKAAV